MELIIDGEKIKNENDFHILCKKELDFPEYHGENLNAFWDVMHPLSFDPLKIIWKNFSISKQNIGNDIKYIIKTFEDLKEEEPNFSYELID